MSRDLAFQILNQESLYFNANLTALSDVVSGRVPSTTVVGKGKLKNGKFYTAWVVTERENRDKMKMTEKGDKHTLRLVVEETKEAMYFFIDVKKLINIANGDEVHTEPFGSGQVPGTERWCTAFIVTEKDNRETPQRNAKGHHRIRLKLQTPQQG